YGPKGVGALFVRASGPRVELTAQIDGGGHEGGLRSGTLNVPGIVGFGEACTICQREMEQEARRLGELRDRLLARLTKELDGVVVHGSMDKRLPNNLNLSFLGVESAALMMAVRDVALSSGSACSTGTPGPSHVLRALGVEDSLVRGAIRIGLGRFNTEEEIEYAAGRIVEAVRKLREASPVYGILRESLGESRGGSRMIWRTHEPRWYGRGSRLRPKPTRVRDAAARGNHRRAWRSGAAALPNPEPRNGTRSARGGLPR
ncbi:MAG: cysteine desulfurase family protein, partial [Bryobacteraceae bacterium]